MHSEDPEYLNSLFNSFKLKHNKSYSNKSEHDHRFDIFKKHAKLITQHNTAFASGDKSYYLALNHHSDKVIFRSDQTRNNISYFTFINNP